MNVRVLSLVVCPLLPVFAAPPDAAEIVRTALELNKRHEHLTRQYSMTQETVKREIGSDGKVKEQNAETFEMHMIAGEPLPRLVRRNGQPLSAEESRKVQTKFDAVARERQSEMSADRKKRIAKYEESLSRRRELLDELPDAFLYRVTGEERIDGHDSWRIEAKPRPGYRPKSMRTSFLTKMDGRFWISKEHNRLVKLEVVTTGPVSFGWILAKLAPGTRFTIEQVRLPDGVWVARRFRMSYDVKVALVKQIRGETEQIMSDYRRIDGTVTASVR